MNQKMLIADCLDVIAGAVLTQLNIGDVLDWIYTGILIASIILSIVLKIKSVMEDKKITAKEIREIQDEVNKGLEAIDKEKEKQTKKSQDKTEEGREDR